MIVRIFQIHEPMTFEIRLGMEALYRACGDAGDWCIVFDDGRRIFIQR